MSEPHSQPPGDPNFARAVREEHVVIAGEADPGVASLAYCSRDSVWLVAGDDGSLTTVGQKPLDGTTTERYSVLGRTLRRKGKQPALPAQTEPAAAPLSKVLNRLRSSYRKAGGSAIPDPPDADGAHESVPARVVCLPEVPGHGCDYALSLFGNSLKLLASSNGAMPLNGLHQPAHTCGGGHGDDDGNIEVELRREELQSLFWCVDWDEVIENCPSPDLLEATETFLGSIQINTHAGPWRRGVAHVRRTDAVGFVHTLAGQVERQSLVGQPAKLVAQRKAARSAAMVATIRERIGMNHPDSDDIPVAGVPADASQLERLRSFGSWTSATGSPLELAERGLYLDSGIGGGGGIGIGGGGGKEGQQQVRLSSVSTTRIFSSVSEAEEAAAGQQSWDRRFDVTLPHAISAEGSQWHQDHGESIGVPMVSTSSSPLQLVLTCSEDGCTSIWSTFGGLRSVCEFNCRNLSAYGGDSEGEFDIEQPEELEGPLVGIHMLGSNVPLGSFAILSVFTANEDNIDHVPMVRMHVLQPHECMHTAHSKSPSVHLCRFCGARSPKFPSLSLLAAHLSADHPQNIKYPDNMDFSQSPHWIGDSYPEMQSIAGSVYIEIVPGAGPSLCLIGTDECGSPCLAVSAVQSIISRCETTADMDGWDDRCQPEFDVAVLDTTDVDPSLWADPGQFVRAIALSGVLAGNVAVLFAAGAQLAIVSVVTGQIVYFAEDNDDPAVDVAFDETNMVLGSVRESGIFVAVELDCGVFESPAMPNIDATITVDSVTHAIAECACDRKLELVSVDGGEFQTSVQVSTSISDVPAAVVDTACRWDPCDTDADELQVNARLVKDSYVMQTTLECVFAKDITRFPVVKVGFMDGNQLVESSTVHRLSKPKNDSTNGSQTVTVTFSNVELSLVATRHVFFKFESSNSAWMPLVVQMSLFGVPAVPRPQARIDRRLLLVTDDFPIVLPRLLEVLEAADTSLALRDRTIELLELLLLKLKKKKHASLLVKKANMKAIVQNGIVLCDHPGVAKTLLFLSKLVRTQSSAKKPVLQACLASLAVVRTACISAHRMYEIFELMKRCFVAPYELAVETLIKEITAAAVQHAQGLKEQPLYSYLRESYGVHELVFEDSCFRLPRKLEGEVAALEPGKASMYGQEMPLKLTLDPRSTPGVDITGSTSAMLLQRLNRLVFPADATAVLDLGHSSLVTHIAISIPAKGGAMFVSVYGGTEPIKQPTLSILERELESGETLVAHVPAGGMQCRYLAVTVSPVVPDTDWSAQAGTQSAELVGIENVLRSLHGANVHSLTQTKHEVAFAAHGHQTFSGPLTDEANEHLKHLKLLDSTAFQQLRRNQKRLKALTLNASLAASNPPGRAGITGPRLAASIDACRQSIWQVYCARWAWRRFAQQNPSLQLPVPPLRDSGVARLRYFLACSCQLVTHLDLGKKGITCNMTVRDVSCLFRNTVISQSQHLSESVSTMLNSLGLSKQTWAQFAVENLQFFSNAEHLQHTLKSEVYVKLKSICTKQNFIMSGPSNPLLLQIVYGCVVPWIKQNNAVPEKNVSLDFSLLEWCLQLFLDALPQRARMQSAPTRPNYRQVEIACENDIGETNVFRLKPSTTLEKMILYYITIKGICPDDVDFMFKGKPIDPTATAGSVMYDGAVVKVVSKSVARTSLASIQAAVKAPLGSLYSTSFQLGGTLDVYAGISKRSKIVATLQHGQAVWVTEFRNDWARINLDEPDLPSGRLPTGWVKYREDGIFLLEADRVARSRSAFVSVVLRTSPALRSAIFDIRGIEPEARHEMHVPADYHVAFLLSKFARTNQIDAASICATFAERRVQGFEPLSAFGAVGGPLFIDVDCYTEPPLPQDFITIRVLSTTLHLRGGGDDSSDSQPSDDVIKRTRVLIVKMARSSGIGMLRQIYSTHESASPDLVTIRHANRTKPVRHCDSPASLGLRDMCELSITPPECEGLISKEITFCDTEAAYPIEEAIVVPPLLAELEELASASLGDERDSDAVERLALEQTALQLLQEIGLPSGAASPALEAADAVVCDDNQCAVPSVLPLVHADETAQVIAMSSLDNDLIPAQLFGLLSHQGVCNPLGRNVFYLIMEVLTKIASNSSMTSLLSVLGHPQMWGFLRQVACCRDTTVQTAVSKMICYVCSVITKLFEAGAADDKPAVVIYPTPIAEFYRMVNSIVCHVLNQAESKSERPARLVFLLQMMLPFPVAGTVVQCQEHHHSLRCAKPTARCTCCKCGASPAVGEHQRVYTCTEDGCMFAICQDCYAPPSARVVVRELSPKVVIQILDIVLPSVITTPSQKHALVMVLHLVELLDQNITATCEAFWRAVQLITMAGDRSLCHRVITILSKLISNPTTYRDSVLRLIATISSCISMMNATSCLSTWELVRCICNNRETNNAFAKQYTVTFCQSLLSLITVSLKQRGVFSNAGDATGGVVRWIECIVAYLAGCALELIFELDTPSLHELSSVDEHGSASGDVELLISMLSSHLFGRAPLRTLTAATVAEASERGNDKSYAEHAISADATYAQLSRSLFNDYVSPNQDLFDQHQEEATDSTEARYFDADFMLRSSVVRLMRGWLSRSADSAEWLFGIICSTGVSSFTSATFGLGLSLITTADVACRVVAMDELLRLIREILKSSGSNFNPRRIDAPALPSHRDVCEHVMQLLCILVQFPEAASQLVKSPCFPELLEAVTMTVPTLPELCERMLVLLANTNSTWMAGFVKQVFESRGGTVPHAAYFKIFTVMAAATNSTSVAEAIAEQANAFILSHPAESLTVLEPCVHTLRNIVRGFPQLLETSIDLPGLVEKTMEYLDSGMGHRIDSSLTSPSAIEQVCLATVCRHNLLDSETAMDTPPTASAGRENHVLLRPGTRVQSTCNTGSVTIGNLGVHISMAAGVIWDKIPGEPQQHDINYLEPVTSDRVGDVTGNEAIFCARLPAPGLSWASDQEKLFGCIVCVESISQGVALVTNSDGEITTVSKGALLPIVYAEDLQLDQTELTTQITACGFTLDLVRLMVPPMVHAFTVKLATAVIRGSSPVDELNELEDLECSRFAHSLLLGLLAMREPRVEHTLLSSTNLAEELLGVIHAEFDAHVLQPNAVMPSLRFWATVSVSKRWCDIFVEHVSVTDLLAYTCKYQEGSPSIVCGPVTTDSIHKLLGKLIGNIMRFHPNTISNVISVHQSIPPAILGYLLRFRRTKTILLQGPEAGIPAADLSIPLAWLNFASQLPVTSGLVLDVPIELSVETIGDRIFGKQRASDAERRIVGGRRGLLEFCGRLCHVGDSVTLTESATAHPGKIVALFPTEVWIDVNGKCQIFRTRSLQYGLVQIERKEEQPEDIDRFQTQGACFAATTQTQGACFAAAEFQPECELVVNCNRSGITVQALPNMDTGGSAGGEGQSPLADFAVAFAQTGSLYSILSTNCSELLRSSGADAPVTNRRAVSRKVSRAAMTARVLDTTTEDIRLYLRMFQSYMSIPGFVHYLLRDPLGKCFVYGFSGCFNPAKFAIKPAQSLVTAGITFRSKCQRTDRMDERFNKVLLYALKKNADATVPPELYVTILQMLLESIRVQSSAVKIASSGGIQWDAALMDCVRPGVYRCFGVDKVEYQPDSPEFSSASSQASTGDYYGSGDGSDENTDHIINLQLPVQTSFQRSHDSRAVLIGDPIELDVPLRLEIRLLEVRPGSSISIGFHPPCRAKSLSQRGRGGAFAPIDRGFWFNVTTGSFAEGMDILPGLNLSIGSAVVFGCGVDWATQTMHFSVGPNIIATLPLEKADGPLCPFVVVLGTAEIETNIGNMPLVCNMPTAVRGPGVHAFTRPAGRSRMIPISRAPKITTTKPPDADDELAMLDSRTTGLPRKLELVGQLLSILPSSLTSDIMSKSSIIDTITAHLANDSITAMSRDADLYLQILQLVQTMIKYGVSPATTQMLATQVAALRQVANAFLTVAKAGKSSGKPATEIGLGLGAIELANALLSTAALFPDPNAGCLSSDNDTGNASGTSGSSDSGAIKVSGGDGSSSDQSMPSASFDIGYSTFLNRELSVRSMEIVGHQFEKEAMKSSGGGMGSKGKAGKIMRELADMMNSLPCEATNAVFVVADENRVDMLQALITGAEGTPYESGCFVFDVYCPDQYPKQCPKVQLITTGRGTSVRFSPNLYATGKVCLSLLGTWEGMDSSESWSTSSTLMQVFTSIQSLIMTKNVYYNEPSISILASPSEAEKLNRGYENIVRYCTVKHAMNDHLRQPQGCFQDVVARHFYAKRDAILQQCEAWLTDASSQSSDDVAYTGLVADHNPELAMNFSSSPLAYHDALETAAVELRSHLGALDEPPPAEDE